jgi:hypothetical protein
MTTADGQKVERQIRALQAANFTGTVEVRLPSGSFSCLGLPSEDDERFVSDTKFYKGNPIYTWTTSTAGITVRIAPEGVELPPSARDRETVCTARTRISGWNERVGRRSYGPWLKVAPQIDVDTSLNMDVRCLDISGYVHSGITVDPVTPEGDDDRVTVIGPVFAGLIIRDIGTHGFTIDRFGNPRDPEERTEDGRLTCSNGFAGLLLKQTTHALIADSTFADISNRQDPRNPYAAECAVTAHGLYLRHDSSHNVVVNGLFTGISGAAVDLAVRADNNRIESSIFNSTGSVEALAGVNGAAPWVLAWWDRAEGHERDAPTGNVLVGAAGDRQPMAGSATGILVPEVACTVIAPGVGREEDEACRSAVRVTP